MFPDPDIFVKVVFHLVPQLPMAHLVARDTVDTASRPVRTLRVPVYIYTSGPAAVYLRCFLHIVDEGGVACT